MTFWIAIVAVSLVAGLWLARAFLRRGEVELGEGEQAISIYRDQIDAVLRDAERGLISEAERAEAEAEIQARALRAARQIDNGLLAPRTSRLAALAVAVAAVAGSGALYWGLGDPGAPDQPLAPRLGDLAQLHAAAGITLPRQATSTAGTADGAATFDALLANAREFSLAGDYVAAVEAYRKAAEASGDDPAVLSAYAEALTLANDNKVPEAAKVIFRRVLESQPLDPRARYYVALGKAQEQDFVGALTDWLALYSESPPDAPWAAMVRSDIVNMARFTGTPLADVLMDATPEEIAGAASVPADEAAPKDRIAVLEAALAQQPKNYEASIELARLKAAAGAPAEAEAVLAAARQQYPSAPFVQQQLSATASGLGLTPGRGPTEADVAAAASMPSDEQNKMIRDMVSGLATRLEREPDDLEGWLMLIRSYAVLEEPEKAKAAAQTAYTHYDGQPEPRQAIQAAADQFGIAL